MAVENKKLNTRILLKYDSYENWSTNNPNLLKGEMAIAVIDVADNTQTHSGQAVPQLLVKVGNGLEGEAGKYNSLPFVSGLAADVHSWAKAATKPSYALNEISGAKEYRVIKAKKTVEGVEVDDEFKYILQARKAGSSIEADWTEVSTIDMAKIEARIAAIEGRMTTAESDIDKLEGTVGDSTKGLVKDVADLKAAVGEGGSVADAITEAINALDTPEGGVSQAAGADGLALNIKQENGIITSISGSIAAETYDAYGSASAVEDKLTAYQTTNDAAVKAAKDAADAAQADIDQEVKDRQAAISGLKMTAAVEGTQEGTVVKFIDKVNQENGIVSAELGELVFNSAYNAETNKAATMSDITNTMANLNGAMRFKGVVESIPTDNTGYIGGDVIIVGTKEHVFDGTNWIELGDETTAGTLIAGITGNSTGAVSKTVTAHTQANGVVTLTYEDIAIAESQVTGLTDKLATMQGEIDAEEERAAKAEKANEDAIKLINGTDTGKSMREVAEDVASDGLEGLTNANIQTLGQDETALVVSQNNGAVAVTKQKIQIAESQVTGLTDALALKATEADLTLAENRIKANEDAIAKLNDADTVAGSVANSIKTAIEGLDKADTAVAGQFVTSVSEENGIITVARGNVNVKDLEQTADTYVVFDCGSSSVNI
jgi:uncharacterized coiled-coil protein SlyX